MADPDNPIELIQIANRIITAAAPNAVKHDPRSGIGKFFDRLFGLTFVNELPELDCYQTKHTHRLSATIYDEKIDVVVNFRHCVEGRGCTSMRLPLAAFEALKVWANSRQREPALSKIDS